MLSIDARVALAPEDTYRQLVPEVTQPRWWQALARPALVLLALALVMSIMATHSVTASLLLTSAIAWSAVVLIQIAAALVTIGSAAGRRVGFARALDLWFAGHLPYSAWILLLPLITASHTISPLDVIAVTFIVPTVWTTFIATAYCRVVLGATAGRARWRVAAHQLVTLTVTAALALWAAGGIAAVASYVVRTLERS
jgi:hypothetical protein